MKYMGSKAALLKGDLGEILLDEARSSDRFVDLFSGSGSVGHFIAEQMEVPVVSVDLQHYSRVLAASITERTSSRLDSEIVRTWTAQTGAELAEDPSFLGLAENVSRLGKKTVLRGRRRSADVDQRHFVTRHYGGHFFSPQQAFAMDRLHAALPETGEDRDLGLAALIHAASITASSPGHTAQPFQPTPRLIPFLRRSWARDVVAETQKQLEKLAVRSAKVKGSALVADAQTAAADLSVGDLVFCDPPYSAVQYSRFYHVLEGLAVGGWDEVGGAGRSPGREHRETSLFSMKANATSALIDLLSVLRKRQVRAIITFPEATASNGLSGEDIVALASDNWKVTHRTVDSVHSTLGGPSGGEDQRGSRKTLKEAVLLLEPKRAVFAVSSQPCELSTRREERVDAVTLEPSVV